VELRGERLDLRFLRGQRALEHVGWLPQPDDQRPLWSRWPEAWLELPFHATAAKELRLWIRAHRRFPEPLDVEVVLNDTVLGVLAVTALETDHTLRLPAAAQLRGLNKLRLRVLDWRRFRGEPTANDVLRFHGARGRWLRVSRLEVGERLDGEARQPRWSGGTLYLPGQWSASWTLRQGAATLTIAARTSQRDSSRLVVTEQRVRRVRTLATTAVSGHAVVTVEVANGVSRLEIANTGDEPLRLESSACAPPRQAAPHPPCRRPRRHDTPTS
jgi:hypothetical protein